METKIFNGIICLHDIPVEMFEYNQNILFLHNFKDPFGLELKHFANFKKIGLSYYISAEQKDENELKSAMLSNVFGKVNTEIESSGVPYSEVTPDLNWTHKNSFGVGGHDLNKRLKRHIGKWLFMKVTRHDE